MRKFKFTRTTENLVFILDLTHNSRTLGESSSEDNESHQYIANSFKYITESRLNEVMSFDINKPYIVGVNGVTRVTDEIVEYIISDDVYVTNLKTNITEVVVKIVNKEYSNKNYFYDNKIGVDGVLKSLDEITVERDTISVIDKFSKLKNVKSIVDVEQLGNGFYKIIDQTVK